jgi:malate dehydrogenase (oxaloacetate-decarboxylating)(NADP+)
LLAKSLFPSKYCYGEIIKFGRDYIIPNHLILRLVVVPAVAKAAMESGVALKPITDWINTKKNYRSFRNDNKMVRLLLTEPK